MRRYRQTTRLVLFCLAVLLGLGFARKAPEISANAVLLFGLLAILSWRKARLFAVYAMILSGFSLGWWRGGGYMSEIWKIANLKSQMVVVTGTALSDSVYDDKSQISFDIGGLMLEVPQNEKLVGKISVSGYGEKMVYRGDKVRVSGKFYPGRGSVVAYLNYSSINVIGKSRSAIYSITRKFNTGLLNALPEPLASFGLGLLIGQKTNLPNEVTAILAAVGLSHIIAVSGYNLTIMMRGSRKIFGRMSKFQIFVASESMIILFLLVTGSSASIIRAGIISSLSLLAWYYGRKIKPLLLILFTAALTALWNPLYLWSDIGWWLSFLAFFGVLVVGPLIRQRIFGKDRSTLIGELVLETLCAQVMTLPIILYIFHTSSVLALPANVLVVPLIPLAMLLTFLAGLAGMIAAPLAGWIAWPARAVLTYLIDMATMFARVPHMQFKVSISTVNMLSMYAAMIFIVIILWRKNTKNGKVTEVRNKEEIHERTFQMVNY